MVNTRAHHPGARGTHGPVIREEFQATASGGEISSLLSGHNTVERWWWGRGAPREAPPSTFSWLWWRTTLYTVLWRTEWAHLHSVIVPSQNIYVVFLLPFCGFVPQSSIARIQIWNIGLEGQCASCYLCCYEKKALFILVEGDIQPLV